MKTGMYILVLFAQESVDYTPKREEIDRASLDETLLEWRPNR